MISHISALLHSKVQAPAVAPTYVSRQRLLGFLDRAVEPGLTVVVAPAGSGKTQLLASWVATTQIPTAWLSIEETDDAIGLLSGLIAAMEQLAPGLAAGAVGDLTAKTPADEIVRAVLRTMASVPAPQSSLVIDDVHLLRDSEATAVLSAFVQHLPQWLHVVLTSRSEPWLPLDRLRVSGQMGEVRFRDLRFTADEARSVLERLAPHLTDDELDESVRRSGGWAAGIQITALAARSAQADGVDATLRSDERLLTADYVWHEVLSAGGQEVVDALVKLSIVERANLSLAAALTGDPNVHDLLLRAERSGMFVHRIEAGDWLEVHGLVREVLLAELERRGQRRELHELAAQWFEGAGEIPEALDHWMLAERPREALRLLGASSTLLYDRGREGVITRTIEAIPRDVTSNDPHALIDFAVSHILVSRHAFVDATREAVSCAGKSDIDVGPQIAALCSIASTMSGDWTNGEVSAATSLDRLGDHWLRDVSGRYAWSITARAVALSERWDDDDALVVTAARQMGRDPSRGLAFEGIRALGLALSGRPLDALRISAGVRHAAASMSILRSEIDFADALARREIADRERALTELRAIAAATDEVRLYHPVMAMLELALAAVDAGDHGEATDWLLAAESLIHDDHGGADLRDTTERVATVVAIAIGDVGAALRRAERVADPFWGPVSRSRAHLARGDQHAAADALAPGTPRCVRHRVVLGLLSARTVAAHGAALDGLTTTVRLAAANGLVQTVVSDGLELIDAIERAAWAVPEEWIHRVRLAIAMSTPRMALGTHPTYEPLTDRERDVLRLLPSRLTLTEIARELYVSVNTLKFHLRVIYRKLGVNSRDEAAAVFRSMAAIQQQSLVGS